MVALTLLLMSSLIVNAQVKSYNGNTRRKSVLTCLTKDFISKIILSRHPRAMICRTGTSQTRKNKTGTSQTRMNKTGTSQLKNRITHFALLKIFNSSMALTVNNQWMAQPWKRFSELMK